MDQLINKENMALKDLIIDYFIKLTRNFLVDIDPCQIVDPFYFKLKSKSESEKSQFMGQPLDIDYRSAYWPHFSISANEILENLTAKTEKLYTLYAFMDLLAKELQRNNKTICLCFNMLQTKYRLSETNKSGRVMEKG
uniref:Uncharacterized protein n=1 Tax=Romanomermis culicivorax TaxID=13658 RepID=A0A915IZ61_ROMCU